MSSASAPPPQVHVTNTVLVVEDNPGDSRLVELYLLEDTTCTFRVLKAALLSEALAILQTQPVDVVLLDLSLPDSYGMQTLQRLRAAHVWVPVVVLTGNNDEVLALEALRQGAQDYLVKGQGNGDLVRRAIRYAIERASAAVALVRSQARFRAVFENAGIGVILLNAEGRFVAVNPAFCNMLDYTEDELMPLSVSELTHVEDRSSWAHQMSSVMGGDCDSFTLQKRYLAKGGRIVWGRLTVTVIEDPEAEDGGVRHAVAVVEDVTERKRLEDSMRLAATVFENTGEGLFVTDADGCIVHVNPAFTEITGYEPLDVLGQNPRVLSSKRHSPEFYQHMWQSLAETGKWQGEIWDRRKSGEMFAGWQNIAAVRDPNGKVVNYVAVLSDITSRKQVEERLSYQANHDPLTRLPNRTLFQERLGRALARAQRNHSMVALLFVDLDRFKKINDTLGHLAGDQLLQQVAERLTGCTRQGDTVARLSGDEFTVILEDIPDARDATVVAHKILHVLVEPFDLGGTPASISSSIGVALYPADAGDPQTMLKLADAAMYRAKHLGRNTCQFHSEAVNAQAFERLALENALAAALDRDEFLLHYQPIFDLKRGIPVAVEALLRWKHPDVGVIIPPQFLHLAEENGLILPIGQWVMETACAQLRSWRQHGNPDLRVHLNLSGRQLRQPDLLERISSCLERHALPPSAIVLEIPEGSVIDKGEDANALFVRMTALGMGLCIDDFGAGLSSFTSLRRLPASMLKVSRSFTRDVARGNDDMEIVTAIGAVAHGLHMAVIAPGVETREQLAVLSGYKCDLVQGFLLARPMSADAVSEFLENAKIPDTLAEMIPS